MRVSKKQLLGFGGLAFVVGLTAIAYNLPTSAVSVGGSVEVQVEVYNINLETVINSPLDGDIVTSSELTFSETHSNADKVEYYLYYINSDGTKTEYKVKEISGSSLSGKTTFNLDLSEYGGSGKYIFRSVATNSDNVTREDSVQFTYAAISAGQESVKTTTDETSFKVKYSPGVKSIVYQVVDKDGRVVSKEFTAITDDPANGGEQTLSVKLGEGALDLTSGRYTIIIKGYSTAEPAEASFVGSDSVYFDYEAPESPEDINVPDTGSILAALNISKSDFLITGLIGFTAISLGALYVVRKSHKK